MDEAKIRLSPKEMELVTNAGWILTKNGILQKIAALLGELQLQYRQILETYPGLPQEVLVVSPKISKGENLRGLPYLVLDQPRYFNQQDVFAIRTLFWWGNFFSITLHLAGNPKRIFEKKIIASLPLLREKDFYFCISGDPWQHHFEEDNYRPLSALREEEVKNNIAGRPFLKIASRFSLTNWDNSITWLRADFETILKVLLN